MRYQPGDKVLIVSKRTQNMNTRGHMDKYLNTVMTICQAGHYSYTMIEDNEYWSWCNEDIVCRVSELYQEVE